MKQCRISILKVACVVFMIGLIIVLMPSKKAQIPLTHTENIAEGDIGKTSIESANSHPSNRLEPVANTESKKDSASPTEKTKLGGLAELPSPEENTVQKGSDDADFINSLELPMPNFGQTITDELLRALEETFLNAQKTKSLEEKVRCYKDFIRIYPLALSTPVVMNRLAVVYADMGRFEDAKRMLNGAKVLTGDNRYVNTLDVTLAYIDIANNKLDKAEEKLRRIMAKPVLDILEDRYAVIPQFFLAPRFLAEVYAKRGFIDEADKMLKDCAERFLKLINENPNIEWLPLYVAWAYHECINLILNNNPNNIDDSRALAEELKEHLPEYTGPHGYAHIKSVIESFERKTTSKEEENAD